MNLLSCTSLHVSLPCSPDVGWRGQFMHCWAGGSTCSLPGPHKTTRAARTRPSGDERDDLGRCLSPPFPSLLGTSQRCALVVVRKCCLRETKIKVKNHRSSQERVICSSYFGHYSKRWHFITSLTLGRHPLPLMSRERDGNGSSLSIWQPAYVTSPEGRGRRRGRTWT